MRRKILSLVLSFSLVLSLLVIPAAAAPTNTFKLNPAVTPNSVTSGDKIAAGSEVTVTGHYADWPENVANITFALGYDDTKLSITNSDITYTPPTGGTAVPFCNVDGNMVKFTLSCIVSPPAVSEGVLFVAKFTARSDITEKLEFTLNISTMGIGPAGAAVESKDDATYPTTIYVAEAITGELPVAITKPAKGNAPQSTIAPTTQYTSTIAWEGSPSTFAANTKYTAHVTLTANTGYQFATGVNPTVTGATGINVVSNDGTTLKFDVEFPQTGDKDALTGKPAITGKPTVGTKLTADVGTLNEADLTKLDYQWKLDGADISSATNQTYTVRTEDVGKAITVTVTAKPTSEYSGSATSDAVTAINKTLTNLEIVTGPTNKTYTHGDPFKTDGMKVKATYNDSTFDADFKGYTVAYETPGKNYLCKDNTKVTLNAGGKSVEVDSLIVGAKELTVPVTATNRTYESGNKNVALTVGTLTGVVGGEEVSLASIPTTGTISNADVGNDKPVSVTSLSLTGADAGNYTLTQPTGIKVNITAKDIGSATITLGMQNTYNGSEQGVVIDSVKVDGTPLTDPTDYTITSGGTATNVVDTPLTIKGKDNYTGTASTTWKLEKATPDASDFDLTPAKPATGGYDYGSGFGGLSAPTTTRTGMGSVTVKYNGSTAVPTNAGTYTVTFDVAEGTNYNAKDGLSIGNLKINPIDYTGNMTATDTVRSGYATTDKTLTLPALPAGASYDASGTVGGTAALIGSHSVSGTTLTYSTTNQTAGTVATITIPVTGATNYNPYDVVVTITAQDKQTLSITGVEMNASSYTYGDTVGYDNSDLSVTGATTPAFDAATLEYIYSGTLTDGSAFTAGTTAPTKAGSYTLTVKVPDSNADYMGQQVINFTIAPKALRSSDLEQTAGAITKTYDGNVAAPGITVGVKSDSLVETTDAVTITGSAAYNSENVSEAAQIIFTPTGTGNVNYTLDASETLTIEGASITAKDVSITGATVHDKNYDGNANATVDSVTITGVSGALNKGTDFEVTSAVFSDANASTTNIDVTINVALKGTAASNYHLTNGTDYPVSGAAKINQATLSEGTDKSDSIRYSDTTEKTFDAAYFGFTKAGTFALNGSVTDSSHVLAAGFPTYGSTVEVKLDTVASLASPAQTVIIPLTFTTSDGNYVGKNVTLTITLTDKTPVTISGLTYADKTYDGNAITPTGTLTVSDNKVPVNELEVLYTSTDGAGYSAATAPKDAGAYKVEYKVADSNLNYTGSVSYTFTISKKAATVAPKAVSITKGSTIPTFELVYTGLVSGESLTPSALPTFTCFEADGTTPVSTSTAAGTYTITWTNTGITFTGANNYDLTKTPTATLTISNPSYYGGGGSYTPSYTVSVDKTENGTITVSPKSASKGDTVTVTVKPDKGYELDTLKVLDKNGDKVKLTEKNGKYTFTMPAGKEIGRAHV